MEKNNNFLKNIAKLLEAGLISSRDLRKEVENAINFKLEGVINKLNLVKREEFEVQKKIIQNLEKEIVKLKKNKKKTKTEK
jgi:BMFP domain-containing protein YqiC